MVGFHPLGVLVDDDEFRQEISGEYYFRLAAGIDSAVRNSGVRTFLFTSPAHGSGTTTVVRKLTEKLRGLESEHPDDNGDRDLMSWRFPEVTLLHGPTISSKAETRLDDIQSSLPASLVALLRLRSRAPRGKKKPLLVQWRGLFIKPVSSAMSC